MFSAYSRIRAGKPSFTMIELLVVVSIMIILISLLIPALSGAKATTRQIVCAKNLKQMGTAFNMYVDDNNGWLNSHDITIPAVLLPYVAPNFSSASVYYNKYKESMLYHCPSATVEDSWSAYPLYSYGENEHMCSGTSSVTYWYIQKAAMIIYPSQINFLTDTNYKYTYNTEHFSFRHRNGINIVYFDNHCAWISQINVMNTLGTSNIRFWYGRDSL